MNRQQKYPDTKTFHYYNANPRNRFTDDCVKRAISTALNLPYNQVVMEMAEMQCKTGYDGASAKGIDVYLKSKGWRKCLQPRRSDNSRYTGADFCRFLASADKSYVANIGSHHIVAIVKGKINDIWDSTEGAIGNYWVRG